MSGPAGSSQWLYNADTSYSIDYSCRIPEDGKFTRTPGSAGNRRTWTWSGWMKNTFAGDINRAEWLLAYDSGETHWYTTAFTTSMGLAGTGIRVDHSNAPSGNSILNLKSPALMRDPSAWRHIVIIFDSTQGTNTNRLRVHVNGVQLTTWNEITWTTQNFDGMMNNAMPHTLGKGGNGDSYGFAGYMAEVHMIDGTAVEPTSFGEFGDYGEWKPKEYDTADGAYGTTGYYLDFSNASALGDDAAGSNDWSATNIAAVDQMLDTPTNNFPTLNGLSKYIRTTYPTEGGLKSVCGNTEYAAPHGIAATMAAPGSGKWYWEIAIGDGQYSKYARVGCADPGVDLVGDIMRGINSASLPWIYAGGAWGIDCNNGNKQSGGSSTSYGSGMADGANIVGIALDVDNGKIWFADNNTWIASGDPAAGTNFAFDNVTSGHILPYVNTQDGTAGFVTCNFGQDSSFAGLKTAQGNSDGGGVGDFYYTPPTGFLALCTKNLPAVAVVPSEAFNVVLYTGTGSSNAITGVGFQPEMTMISERDESEAVAIVDILRSNTVELNFSGTAGESDDAQKITAIGSDGFTVGTSAAANQNTNAHVSYHWKFGGAGSANTAGSINSTITANTDAGMSIVKYAGTGSAATVGHGLGAVPEMMWVKNIDRTKAWSWYHVDLGNTHSLSQTDAGKYDNVNRWNDTTPTSTVFTIGNSDETNYNGDDHIAYCFAEVEGFSKIGRYSGNGTTEGCFVYTGFRPKFIFIKNHLVNREPVIFDSKRDAVNPAIEAMSSRGYAETSSYGTMDILSNGFKLRSTTNHTNEDDDEHVYIAFAETPFKYSNAR